jgi:uncharacterized Zn finger protein
MLKRKEIKTFITHLYCDNCDTEMQSTGKVLTSNSLQFEYCCPNCGTILIDFDVYPKTEYVEID